MALRCLPPAVARGIPVRYLPVNLMWLVSHAVELVVRLRGGNDAGLGDAALLTPAAVTIMNASNFFDDDRIRRVMGYREPYSYAEGLSRTADQYLASLERRKATATTAEAKKSQ